MTLTRGLITFALEAVGLGVAVLVVMRVLAARGVMSGRAVRERRVAIVAVLSVVVIASAFANMESAASLLAQSDRDGVSARAGIDTCLDEDNIGATAGFAQWLQRRIPPHAIYAYETGTEPDEWCLTLLMLPRLPALGARPPGWLIAYGAISPQVQAQIDRHDPNVSVYAPGYALVRLAG